MNIFFNHLYDAVPAVNINNGPRTKHSRSFFLKVKDAHYNKRVGIHLSLSADIIYYFACEEIPPAGAIIIHQ